jgi:mono/diheme cytochrome c family protein
MAKKRSGGGFGKLLLGFLLGVVAVVGAAYAWLQFGKPPASVRQVTLPLEKQLDHALGQKHVEHAKRVPPFGISEDVFEDGAKVYHRRCANCHGVPGRDNGTARQLWKRQGSVSGEDPGDIYSQIADGLPSSGMPAFGKTLSDTEIWQVSLLLKNADMEIPDPVVRILQKR